MRRQRRVGAPTARWRPAADCPPRRPRWPAKSDGPSDDAPSDPVEIFLALNGHGVDYLIIGGVAAQAYGHVRTTQDVDVIVAPDARNLERLAAALTSGEGREAEASGRPE